jgi:hypothetical protein
MSATETTTGELPAQSQAPAPASRRRRRVDTPATASLPAITAGELPLAAYPVARLLPPEVVASGRARTTRALMCYLVALVLLLAVAATYFAHAHAMHEQQQLTAIEGQTSSVLAQEAKFSSVRAAQNRLKLAKAAQRVGAGSAIDWDAYFAKVEALLPPGTTMTDFSGQTASPIAAVPQDSAPLATGRAAIVTVTIAAPSATAIADATDAFAGLPGYARADIGAMTQGTGGAASPGWSAPVTISLTQAAFSGPSAATKK